MIEAINNIGRVLGQVCIIGVGVFWGQVMYSQYQMARLQVMTRYLNDEGVRDARDS